MIHKLTGYILQGVNMLSDLILIGIILFMFYLRFYIIGTLSIIFLWSSISKTGGLFYSWKKENREKFWKNWNKLK